MRRLSPRSRPIPPRRAAASATEPAPRCRIDRWRARKSANAARRRRWRNYRRARGAPGARDRRAATSSRFRRRVGCARPAPSKDRREPARQRPRNVARPKLSLPTARSYERSWATASFSRRPRKLGFTQQSVTIYGKFPLNDATKLERPRGKDVAARSCLILPDDPRLEAEAWLACGASALLLDLREPRAGALAFLRQAREFGPRPALYARLGPVEHPGFDLALESMLERRPTGFFWTGPRAAPASSTSRPNSPFSRRGPGWRTAP